ncbi:hypothetical protein TWF730_001500 [Orbilia blumenaviensis]|uniref:Uncharacterized protein n=1 Tax=Orbilia blumenaviensis TaxID=1796055 RepID=A0AAV9UP28_9PEZI
MYCYLGVIYLFIIVNIGIASAAPRLNDKNIRESNLEVRGWTKAQECDAGYWQGILNERHGTWANAINLINKADWLAWRLENYQTQCFYQGEGTDRPQEGVELSEFAEFWATKYDLVRANKSEEMGVTYTFNSSPDGSRCQQVWCIGEFASLRVCDFREEIGPVRNATFTAKQLYGAFLQFGWSFWTGISLDGPMDVMKGQVDGWSLNREQMDTCCLPIGNRDSRLNSRYRLSGSMHRKDNPGLRITLEPTVKVGDGKCDPSKNAKPSRAT